MQNELTDFRCVLYSTVKGKFRLALELLEYNQGFRRLLLSMLLPSHFAKISQHVESISVLTSSHAPFVYNMLAPKTHGKR